MKLAMVAAGFTAGEADQLRRAMAAWKRKGGLIKFRPKLIDGMLKRGYTADFAERLYNQICGFGDYGFPESHAASFALLVYASAWLKCYHPAIFLTSLLNSQPMGFYAPAQLVSDARRHGVEVRPADVNHSNWECTLERLPNGQLAVRLGTRMIDLMGESAGKRITAERASGAYRCLADFVDRTRLGSRSLKALARADAFKSLGLSRREALWQAMALGEASGLFAGVDDEPRVELPAMTVQQEVTADYQTTGFSLRRHPMQFLRQSLVRKGVVTAAELLIVEPDRRYRVAGLVLIRQRPGTAKGITFMTLEDETGTANLIVHRDTWERFRTVARRSHVLAARGILQRQEGVIHLVVDHLQDLTETLATLNNQSRDFR